MGTTRIKVIDLSSTEGEIKTSRKHAEKLAGVQKLKDNRVKEEPKPETKNSAFEQDEQNDKSLTLDQAETEEKSQADNKTQTSESTDEKEKNITLEEGKPTSAEPKEEKEAKTPQVKSTKQSAHHSGAKYKKAASAVEDKNYLPKEAFTLLPKTSFTKFDPSVEVHLTVAEKNIKVTVNMPHLKAEKKQNEKYLIFADKTTKVEGQTIIWGDDKTINQIEDGSIKPGKDFTIVVASAKYMPKLAKVAKILGPKGLMPNPKNGTVTEDYEKLFKGSDSSGILIKTDPTAPIVHTKIGKLSQKQDELEANFKALVTAIGPAKVKKATLTTTMGPAVHLDATKLIAA